MALKSTDYADLLRYLAYKRRKIIINKTQVNKLLFMCYGTYLVENGQKLFEEQPKAWPFGPVFPKVYKTFDQKQMPFGIPSDNIRLFNENTTALRIIYAVIDRYSHVSAYDLSMWSHKEGSPWYQTVYSEQSPVVWNKVIDDEIIKQYFKEHPVIN